MRPSRVGLALVLAAAATLRFWELGHGIPHAIGLEEPQIVNRAFQMMRGGTLNPEFFEHGHLHIYLQLALSVVRFMAGSMTGEWYSLNEASVHPFYLWGRGLSALLGTLTVLLVYLAGLRWGARTALLSAALVAVLPVHVEYSHLVVPDVLLTFLVALVFLTSLSAAEKGTAAAFAVAGAAAGLAAAARYHGAIAVLMPLTAIAIVSTGRDIRGRNALATLAGLAGGFLIAAPYTLVNFPQFLDTFAQLAAANHATPPPAEPAAFYYARAIQAQFAWPRERGAVPLTWLPSVAVLVAGFAMAVFRAVKGPGRVRWAVAATAVAAFYTYISARNVLDPRHILPLMPVLCVLGAAAVIAGVSMLRRFELSRQLRTAAIALLTLAILAPASAGAIRFDRGLSRRSTTDLAYDWIRQNLTHRDVVVVEASVLTIPRGVVDGRGIGELREKTREEFLEEGVQYLVASSSAYGRYLAQPQTHRAEYLAYARLFSQTREVARFSPNRVTRGPELRVLRLGPLK